MMARLRDWLQTAYRLLCAGILLWLWGAVFVQFYGAMLPRLSHMGPAGMVINDWPCDSPQCDFAGFWAAGLLARAKKFMELFSPDAFLAFLHQHFSPAAAMIRWYYPPPTLLPATLISHLPFEAAFWVWSAGFLAGAALLLRYAGMARLVILATLLSPAALWNLELGQFGIIMGAAQLCGLLCLAKGKPSGGAVLGLLIFKPQYGILAPVAMIASRGWRFMLACALVSGLILLLSAACLGTHVWGIYVTQGLQVSRHVLEIPPDGHNSEKFGVSVFWMVRSFGGTLHMSYMVQLASSVAAAVLTWLAWRSRHLTVEMRASVTVMLSLLATPYGYTDDMVAWSAVLAISAHRRGWRVGFFDVLFWIWPMLCPIVSARTGLLFTPLVVLLSLWRSVHDAGLFRRLSGNTAT